MTASRLLAAIALVPVLVAPAQASERLDLPAFFEGRTHGSGKFVSPLFGTERTIAVDTVGKVDGDTLVLTEYVRYGDGQRETAIWRFERAGDGRYDGRRSRVAGVVPVRTGSDGAVRMGYVAEVNGPDGAAMKLRFEDTLRQTDPRTVVNTARVTYAGIEVGSVEITFVKR